MTAQAEPIASPPPAPSGHADLSGWARSLGDIPFGRIVLDPWPGTATDQDLLRFVERDKRLCELIDGTLVEKPVGYDEESIGSALLVHMWNFVKPRKLGWVNGAAATIRMASGRVRLPDVSFVARSAFPEGQRPRGPIPLLPPTLAVEVLSDSNSRAEMHQKLREYFESGCKLAWLIDPRTQTAEIYRAPGEPARRISATDELDGEDVLPGFKLRLGDLFEDL